MANHTKGPWALPFITERPIGQEVFSNDGRIAIVDQMGKATNTTSIANALLIASAPDLLAACRAAYELATGDRSDGDDVAAMCRIAIARAEYGC